MMLGPGPDGPFPIGRNLDIFAALFIASHVAKEARIAILDFGGPHLLLRLFKLTAGAGDMSAIVQFAAAVIDDRASVGREAEAGDRHSIVTLIMSNLTRFEVRSVGDPDIAFAFVIEDPGNTRSLHGAGETRGKR